MCQHLKYAVVRKLEPNFKNGLGTKQHAHALSSLQISTYKEYVSDLNQALHAHDESYMTDIRCDCPRWGFTMLVESEENTAFEHLVMHL